MLHVYGYSYAIFTPFYAILFPVPPRRVQINERKGQGLVDTVNVTCVADYVFPEPVVHIYHGQSNNRYANFYANLRQFLSSKSYAQFLQQLLRHVYATF